MYAYVVIFAGVNRSDFIEQLKTFPTSRIANWYACLPQTVFIASPMAAKELSAFLRKRFPTVERLLVLDANTDRNGWLPQTAWAFFRNPSGEE